MNPSPAVGELLGFHHMPYVVKSLYWAAPRVSDPEIWSPYRDPALTRPLLGVVDTEAQEERSPPAALRVQASRCSCHRGHVEVGPSGGP
jgi:hypothetical protein